MSTTKFVFSLAHPCPKSSRLYMYVHVLMIAFGAKDQFNIHRVPHRSDSSGSRAADVSFFCLGR